MRTEVAIIGGGPGGATLGMYLAKEGIQSVIIEKETFPRYHIGESLTGEAGGLLRSFGLEPQMLRQKYPIKHGVMVYGPTGKTKWYVPVMRRNEANALEPIYTWQVRRSTFDKLLLEEAVARGAILVHGHALTPLFNTDGAISGVQIKMADGGIQDIKAEVVVDASGLAQWLSHLGVASKRMIGKYDKQVAIFSQVAGVHRDGGQAPGDTVIFYKEYLHWAWFIPIDDEVVSVGVVSPASHFQSKRESKHRFLMRELHELNPELRRLIPAVNLVDESRAIVNYSYRIHQYTGKGWLCIGDAHRFVDPIFSFGLYVSITEASLASKAIKEYLQGAHRGEPDPFAAYKGSADEGMDKFETLIDAFWANPLAFAWIAHQKYVEDTIDLFAGRVHGWQHSPGLAAMRALVTYDTEHKKRSHPGHASEVIRA